MRIAPNHPVMLTAFTGHGTLLNSRRSRLIGIDDIDRRILRAARYGRDERGPPERPARGIRAITWPAGGSRSRPTPREIVRIYRRFAAEASAWGITSHAAAGDSLPVAEASKHLVDAGRADAMESLPLPDARGRGGDDRQPSAAAAAAVAARRRARHEVDSRRHADRAAGFMRAPYPRCARASAAGSISPQSASMQFVGWAYGSGGSAGGPCRSAMAPSMRTSPRSREAGRAEVWRDKRPRIEHGDMMAPDLIARVKAMGMVVVQNPMHFMFPRDLRRRVWRRNGWPGCSR